MNYQAFVAMVCPRHSRQILHPKLIVEIGRLCTSNKEFKMLRRLQSKQIHSNKW